MVSIGAAARQSGLSVETVRFYERAHVVPPPQRSESGRRIYDDADIARLSLIRRCRDLGFSLPDARNLLALSEADDTPCAEVKAIAEAHLAGVHGKIAALREMETALNKLVSDCAVGKTDCQALRVLARQRGA